MNNGVGRVSAKGPPNADCIPTVGKNEAALIVAPKYGQTHPTFSDMVGAIVADPGGRMTGEQCAVPDSTYMDCISVS
jgi:hypothetical protein